MYDVFILSASNSHILCCFLCLCPKMVFLLHFTTFTYTRGLNLKGKKISFVGPFLFQLLSNLKNEIQNASWPLNHLK